MTIPPVYIASALAVLVFIAVLIKLFKRPENHYEFVDIETEPDTPDTTTNLPGLITIYLVPKHPVVGQKLLAFFLEHQLQFNEKQKIFHAISNHGKQFYVATLSSPGTFDIQSMPTDQFTGLSFFMQPQESQSPLADFDALCQTLFDAKEVFDAHLQNDHKEEMSLEQLREIRDQLVPHQ